MKRISRLAAGRRSRWWVIGVWVLLAAALAPLQPKLQDRAADESETFLVRGSDSAAADRTLDQRFTVGDEVVTTIVYELPPPDGTSLSGQDQRLISDAEAICNSSAIRDLRAVFTPLGPACDERDTTLDISPETPLSPVSDNGRVALTTVLTGKSDTTTVVDDVQAIRDMVGGDDVHITGEGGFDADRALAVEGIDGTLLAITAALILVILLAVYRSPLTAAVPLGVVAVAYLVAAGATWGLVSAGATTISGQTTAILIVLMFGAGTDYCLLIVARFRDELRRGADTASAMATAAERTAPAILSAGAIVAGAMLLLGLADFNATREMGPILALGMAVMVLAGLTLLPAVLAVLGRRVFWPARRATEGGEGMWARAARLVERRPAPVAIAVTAILAAGALGNLGGRENLDFTQAFRDAPDSVEGARAIMANFPPGRTAPLDLVATATLSGDIIGPISELPQVESAQWSSTSDSGGLVKIEIVLGLDPFSREAIDSIPRLRDEIDGALAAAVEARGGGSGREVALLGGLTAESYDTEQAVAGDTRLIVPLALVLILLVLAVLLRAIVAPLYLVATAVLSFLFALGVGSLVFTHLMDQPGSDPSLPVFTFVFLVGLGVDYNVFLVSRIQEERRAGQRTRAAVVRALARTGGVITSAGLILAGTFAALMALTFEALFQVGFVIALGLLVDTFLVRALLVPSLAWLLGDRNWWPWGG